VTYIPQDAPLGLAHAVLTAADFLGDDDFVMFLGDNLIEGGITRLRRTVPPRPSGRAAAAEAGPDPQRFGVAELTASGEISRLVEKPTEPASDLALVGVYLFTSKILDAARRIEPSGRGELEITDAIQRCSTTGPSVRASVVRAGGSTPARRTSCSTRTASCSAPIAARRRGEVDADSVVVGEVVVIEGADSSGRRCGARRSSGRGASSSTASWALHLHRGAQPDGGQRGRLLGDPRGLHSCRGISRMEGSLLGRDVELVPNAPPPAAHRFMLGDHSQVEIEEGR
jgi:glucose-1-phosphate thymidylyltransferase